MFVCDSNTIVNRYFREPKEKYNQKMKRNYLLITLLSLITLFGNAQSININPKIEKLLIGEWNFVKTVDEKNNEVKFITKEYKDPFGEEIQIDAKGPELKLNEDHTYLMKFTDVNSDTGSWKLVNENTIIYKMIISKKSKEAQLINETQSLLDVKWDLDSDGNYINTSTDEIIFISANELKIRYEKKYILIYNKEIR